MSVLLETSVGDIVIDLHTAESPLACSNFLKLCAIKYYNDCTFHTVKRGFLIQTGDPTNTGKGGDSIHSILAAHHAAASASSSSSLPSRLLRDERLSSLSHRDKYTVSMVCLDGVPDSARSQFFITTAPALHSLDGRHTVFGQVAEGQDAVDRINAAPVDESGRPAVHIRIRHTLVLDDPFSSPPQLLALIPPASPSPVHTPFDYEVIHAATANTEIESSTQPVSSSAASSSSSSAAAVNPHAVVLEMIGDLPSADVAPPETVLFVCKLNPITTSEDLRLIFSRFGAIVDCSVVTDSRTGASLCYAFIEYAERSSCESAYLKMDNVIIDDRRIRVDFSQSVSRQWRTIRQTRRGGAAAAAAAGGARGGRVAPGRAEGGKGSRWGQRRSDAAGAEQQLESERKEAGRHHVEERKEATRESDRKLSRDERAEGEKGERQQREHRGGDDDRHSRRREERDGDHERDRDRGRHRERSRDRRRSGSEEDERERHSRHRRHRSSRSHSRHHRHRHESSSSRSPSRSRSRSPHRT